jgi:hypothetical protein
MNSYILGAKKIMMNKNKKVYSLNSSVNLISDRENADCFREIGFAKTRIISSLYLDENLICFEIYFRENFAICRLFIFEYSDVVSMNGGKFKAFIDHIFIEQVNEYDPKREVEELRMSIDKFAVNSEKEQMYKEFFELIYNRNI